MGALTIIGLIVLVFIVFLAVIYLWINPVRDKSKRPLSYLEAVERQGSCLVILSKQGVGVFPYGVAKPSVENGEEYCTLTYSASPGKLHDETPFDTVRADQVHVLHSSHPHSVFDTLYVVDKDGSSPVFGKLEAEKEVFKLRGDRLQKQLDAVNEELRMLKPKPAKSMVVPFDGRQKPDLVLGNNMRDNAGGTQ